MVRPRDRSRAAPLNPLAEAYSDGAAAWADGPTRVYGRLAQMLVDFSPVSLTGRSVLDLGSGTGEGSRAASAAGAHVMATDLAVEMLRIDQRNRPPATAGDALALPFRADSFDVVLAPFSLNHLHDPGLGVREAARISRLLLASTYAADDDHPVKAAVETVLGAVGWERPEWYSEVKATMAAWGTVAAATAVIEGSDLDPVRVERHEIAFPDLGPDDMVAWRLGLAHCAPFVATLDAERRSQVVARALELLGPDPTPIMRRVIFVAAARR
ncbi:MAG: demethylmenaquinone methyltransferase / 2-methoxy-6-polyprenyl,4-benzoquinol methylase [Acidimicrobiaceae bacterium]